MPGTTQAASTLVNSDPGPITIWSASPIASSTAGGGVHVGRHERETVAPLRPRHDPDLADQLAGSICAVSTTGTLVAGSDRPTAPSSSRRLFHTGEEVAFVAVRAARSRLPKAWPPSSPAFETVLEGVSERRALAAATPPRQRGGHRERACEASSRSRPRGPAVVGDRDHGGQLARRTAPERPE